MVDNTPFNEEWNKLQKTFWDNIGSNFVSLSNSISEEHSTAQAQHSSLFDLWLTDVDKCWQDHAQVTSTDIDSLYKKITSSSRFFFNFTESVTSTKQGETADVLVAKYLEGFSDNKTPEEDSKSPYQNSNFDINAFWKLPLENWQQQTTFFTSQQQSLNTLSSLFVDAVKSPDFFTAIEAYLIALQKYQLVLFNLFTDAAKQVVESLRSYNDKPVSPKQIMTIWLEILETNYMLLISGDSYSQVYADVVNSWMVILGKSNKPFAEFMQTNNPSAQAKPKGQR